MLSKKVRENRVRRVLARRGYRLIKTRRRDQTARDYGGYLIVDLNSDAIVAGIKPFAFALTLKDVETWLEKLHHTGVSP